MVNSFFLLRTDAAVFLSVVALLSCFASSVNSQELPGSSNSNSGGSSKFTGHTVQVTNGKTPGSLELRADGPIKLAPELNVERLNPDGSFVQLQSLDLGTMKLVTDCDKPVGTFVVVDQRGLRPVPWTGMSCSSQCNYNCDKNVPYSGSFRFFVNSFDHKTRFDGSIFVMSGKSR